MAVFTGVIKNTLAQGLGRAGSVLVSIVLTSILYRTLAEEGFGAYSFISAFVLLFGHISDWGTNLITVREAAKDKSKQAEIFGSLVLFRIFLAIVSFAAVNAAIRLNPSWDGLVGATTVGSFVLLFLSLKTSSAMIFQTLFRLELTAAVDFLSSVSFLVLTIIALYYYPNNLSAVMFVWVMATLLSAVVGMALAVKLTKVNWSFNSKIVKHIFLEAIPTGALLISFSLYNRIDIVILQHFKGSAELAPYALAYKIYDNSVLGAAFLMNSLFPHLSSEFAKESKVNLKIYYQKSFDILLTIASVLFIGFFVFAPLIIFLLSGSFSNPAIPLLRILSFAVFVAYFNHLTGFSLIAAGRQKTSLVIALLALTFNIAANFIFVPTYSYWASAFITVATECLVLLISTLVIWKSFGILPSLTSFPKTFLGLVKNNI